MVLIESLDQGKELDSRQKRAGMNIQKTNQKMNSQVEEYGNWISFITYNNACSRSNSLIIMEGNMKTFFSIVGALALLFASGTLLASGDSKETSSRAWLGVSVQDVTADQAKELGLKKPEGAYVNDVVKKSPAETAGIQKSDVIVEFNGRQIYDADGLVSAVKKTEVGAKVKVIVVRKGERKDLLATIGKHKRRMNFAFTPPDFPHQIRVFKGPSLGMDLIPLSPQLGRYFETPEGKGLLVERVEEGSTAEKAGFMAGDVITKVNDKRVSKVHEFRSELAEYQEGDKVDIEIIRKGSRKTLTVEIEDADEEGFDFSIGEFDLPDRINVDVPRFDFNFDELRAQLDKLRKELDKLKKKIEEKIDQRLIRGEFMPET
jgi:C-terminal processing protease CtpA/Prc